jgi:predicted Zn-ribbon and HTH transcriptional regulator
MAKICNNCGFRTERVTTGKKCPNCSREELENEKSAEELISELDSEK